MKIELEKEKIQKIKFIVAILVVLIAVAVVIFRVAKYQKEGEKNMPYSISKIIVVSTATKYEKEPDTKNNVNKLSDQNNEQQENAGQNAEQNNEQQENTEQNENQNNEQQENASQNEEKNNEQQENTEQNENQNNEQQENANQNGEQTTEQQDNSMWKFDLIQTNDMYISIEKNQENIKKNEKIKSVSIENIEIEGPNKGKIKAFMPNSLDGEKYKYIKDYEVEKSLRYRSADGSNFKDLQISSNGGVIGISFANTEVGTYVSGEDTEITYNGTLLAKLGLTNEDVKSKIKFNLIIELDDGKKYSGNVTVDIPCDQLIENGTSQIEITDFSNVIFKRI